MSLHLASEALARFVTYLDVKTVIDVGSGSGEQAAFMRACHMQVTTLSLKPPADVLCDFMAWTPTETFDGLWCSHCLEHQPNVGAFLRKCGETVRDDGLLAFTVPPLKHEVMGGHLNMFNAGTLLYNLIVAGFDCSQARVATYGYNISVIVRKRPAQLPALDFDHGDVRRLHEFFPRYVNEGFDGRTIEANWN